MQKIFTGEQIREWDLYTIEHEAIRSYDLMERASKAITKEIVSAYDNRSWHIVVLAGPGNNGGDALAVARLLAEEGYSVEAFLFNTSGKISDDCMQNAKILQKTKVRKFTEVTVNFEPPQLDETTVVVDGLFGSGLTRPLTGGFASLVKYVNASPAQVVSIDIPSGMMTEDNSSANRQYIIKANLTITIQQKKLAMYLADNAPFFGNIKVVEIGLSTDYMRRALTPYVVATPDDIHGMLLPRSPFAHKGSMGHAMIFAGSYGMAGAAVLAAKACLRSGAGKVSVHTPLCNNNILQISVPEAIVQHDNADTTWTEPVNTDDYEAVCIGPGLGRSEETAITMMTQLRRTQCAMVIDADALNMLADHRPWISQMPRGLILTPHPAEFDRLAGMQFGSDYERLAKAHEIADQYGAYIILKGHHTAICTPDGETIINTTGNAGMATAGSGDVLAGIITALLARGYQRRTACILGVYLHGLAGDIAAEGIDEESLLAGDIIDNISGAYRRIRNNKQNRI